MRNIILSAILMILHMTGYSQALNGVVVTGDGSGPVPYVNVINRTKHLGTTSDANGRYRITAQDGDEIMISSIGFKTIRFTLDETAFNHVLETVLDEEIYDITGANVSRYAGNYATFKSDVIRSVPEIRDMDWSKQYITKSPEWGFGYVVNSPVSFMYFLLSHEGRSMRHLAAIIDGSDENVIIAQKFNGIIVRNLTGLQGIELLRFISYCNFNMRYLLYASQNEIRRAILIKYEQYKREI